MRDTERRERLVPAQVTQRRRLKEDHRTAGRYIGERPGEGITALHQQSLRQTTAQFNLQSVVVSAATIFHGEGATQFVGIDQEEVGWQPGRYAVVAEGRAINETARAKSRVETDKGTRRRAVSRQCIDECRVGEVRRRVKG